MFLQAMDQKSSLKTLSDVLQIVDIALDSYDDIFSDFDPSPYTTRTLSVDFLNELYRRYSQSPKGNFVVNLTVPSALRSEKTEHLIRKRIKDHFREREKTMDARMRDKVRSGLARVSIGVIISAVVLLVPTLDIQPVLVLLSVLIWYFLWSGFDLLFEVPVKLRMKKARADKYLNADYNFLSTEEVIQTLKKLQEAPMEQPRPWPTKGELPKISESAKADQKK
jgi:hypothetical protein